MVRDRKVGDLIPTVVSCPATFVEIGCLTLVEVVAAVRVERARVLQQKQHHYCHLHYDSGPPCHHCYMVYTLSVRSQLRTSPADCG